MREELGIAGDDSPHIRDLFHQKYRGSRYSFGYPACPSLEDQTKLFALLHPDETIGVHLTTGLPARSRAEHLRHCGTSSCGEIFCDLADLQALDGRDLRWPIAEPLIEECGTLVGGEIFQRRELGALLTSPVFRRAQ